MPAIAKVRREVYFRHFEGRGAACVSGRYVGSGLRRTETLSCEHYDDWHEGYRVRTSDDNGRTWSDWQPMHQDWPMKDGFSMEKAPTYSCYDPVSRKHVQFVFQRLTIGKGNEAIARMWKTGEQTYFDHNFWQVSDDGLTWSEPQLLKYESGPDFDPGNWAEESHLRTNQMCGGFGATATRNGTIVYPSCGVPIEITDRGKKEKVDGLRCFVGTWNPGRNTYNWEVSEPICVPRRVSGRGLMEPVIAELADGRLMVVMRGSNEVFPPDPGVKVENGGHKWMILSSDGGRTWSAVTDLRYDTGEQFYSASAFAMLLRHTRTGKLYCFLNISPGPTNGNGPRRPLHIAEVDETIPAIGKDTVTVIDDRDPEKDADRVQMSNFCVFEDRETGDLEMYMTRYGERPYSPDGDMADAYRFVVTLCG